MNDARLKLWRQWRGSKRMFQFKFCFFFFMIALSVSLLAGAGVLRTSGLALNLFLFEYLLLSAVSAVVIGGSGYLMFRFLVRRLAEGPVKKLDSGRSGLAAGLLNKLDFAELVARLPVLEEEHRMQQLNSRREAKLNAAVLGDWIPPVVDDELQSGGIKQGRRCWDDPLHAVLLTVPGGVALFNGVPMEEGYAAWSKVLGRARHFAESRGMILYRFTPEYCLLLEGKALGGRPCNTAETAKAAAKWCRDVRKILGGFKPGPATGALLLCEQAVVGRLDVGRGPLTVSGPLLHRCATFLRTPPGEGVWRDQGWPEPGKGKRKIPLFQPDPQESAE